jgi:hypothetical protein
MKMHIARQSVYHSVNFTVVLAYLKIGKRIVVHKQLEKKRASYGEALLKELSKNLQLILVKVLSRPALRITDNFVYHFPTTLWENNRKSTCVMHFINKYK